MYFIIDYRNGGMGHTILAHALFACRQLNFDINKLFSSQAHAHAIGPINSTRLICNHDLEKSLTVPSTTILTVRCQGWDEVLRKILSYHKYYEKFPTPETLDEFLFFKPANVSALEYLTITYFDSYDVNLSTDQAVLDLGQYLDYKLDPLIESIETNLDWAWDHGISKQFHSVVIEKNQQYLVIFEEIKDMVYSTLQNKVKQGKFEFWQKALILSALCREINLHPSKLHWDSYEFLNNDNQSLIKSINAAA